VQSLGNAFPLWRLRSGQGDAHQSKIFGNGIPIIPPGPEYPAGLTSCRLLSSAPHLGFLSARSTLTSSVARLPHTAR
jgi:hypothetical protein